jgi:tRNA(Arg) A34 adenosine deaminase TadA
MLVYNNSTITMQDLIDSGKLIQQQPVIVLQYEETLATWATFLSATLLSLGGCVSMCMGAVNRSRCKYVGCGPATCVRENLPAGQPS